MGEEVDILQVSINPLPGHPEAVDAVIVMIEYRGDDGTWRFLTCRDFWMTPGTNGERANTWIREVLRERKEGQR